METAGNAEAGAVQVEAEAEGSPVTEVQAEAEETAAEEPAREVFTGYSDSDYDVLLRIVQAEAGNCDMEGRVMVANVILNMWRMTHSRTRSRRLSTRNTSFHRCPTAPSRDAGSQPRRWRP